MRSGGGGGYGGPGSIGEGLKWILIVNVVMFLLQNIAVVWFKGLGVEQYLALNPGSVKGGYIWTFLTYSVLHGDFMHLLFNMLVIFFIGQGLEGMLGTRKFLKLYLGAVLMGGLVWFVLKYGGNAYLVGASAGAMGLISFFCLLRPEQPMTLLLFFVLPVTVKPKWVFWGLLGMEVFLFVFYELPGNTVVASSAHLGGFLGGVIMFQYLIHGSVLPKVQKIRMMAPKWAAKGKIIHKTVRPKYKVNVVDKDALKGRVDEILDKINRQGFGSLTREEKDVLDQAKDVLDNNK